MALQVLYPTGHEWGSHSRWDTGAVPSLLRGLPLRFRRKPGGHERPGTRVRSPGQLACKPHVTQSPSSKLGWLQTGVCRPGVCRVPLTSSCSLADPPVARPGA